MFLEIGGYQARHINSMKIDEVAPSITDPLQAKCGKLPIVNQSFGKLSRNPSYQHILCNPSYCAPPPFWQESSPPWLTNLCPVVFLYRIWPAL